MDSMKNAVGQLICHQKHTCFHSCGHIMTSTTHSRTCTNNKYKMVCLTLSITKKALPVFSAYEHTSCPWCNNDSKYLELQASSIQRSDPGQDKLGSEIIAQRSAFWIRIQAKKETEQLCLQRTESEKLWMEEHEERLTYLGNKTSSMNPKLSSRMVVESLPDQTVVKKMNDPVDALTASLTRNPCTAPLTSDFEYPRETTLQILEDSVGMINGRLLPYDTDGSAYYYQFCIISFAHSALEAAEYKPIVDTSFTDRKVRKHEDEDDSDDFKWPMSAVYGGSLRWQGVMVPECKGRNKAEQSVIRSYSDSESESDGGVSLRSQGDGDSITFGSEHKINVNGSIMGSVDDATFIPEVDRWR